MADFSAVIRRAIGGLSVNAPEERGRIYGRARATIQRQLDSLPEGMNRTIFEAQLVKIEDSILEIEQEYADAAPALSEQESALEQNQTDERPQQSSEGSIPQPPTPVEKEVTQPEIAVEVPTSLSTTTVEIEQEPIEQPVESPFQRLVETPLATEDIAEAAGPEALVEKPIADVSAPSRNESLNSAEYAIDSELQIPEAPHSISIVPSVSLEREYKTSEKVPFSKQVDNSLATMDNGTNLIDQAVNEIRSTLQDDTSDKASFSDPNLSFGFGEEALPEAPTLKQRKSPAVIIIAVLLLIFVAFAFFFWRVGWQGIQDLLPQSIMESTEVSVKQEVEDPVEQSTQVDQIDQDATSTDEVAVVAGETEKFTQRLNSDGSEVDAGRASDLIDGLPNEEGRSVASADASDDVLQSEPIITQADAAAPALQKMFFYETSLGLEQQVRYEGSIAWSEKTESDFKKSRSYIEGTIQVPERDLSIVMTIKLNGDKTLPVSHLIDFNFSLPEEFDGGEVEQITEVKFKSSEEQTGDRLDAIFAKIDTSYFVVGLQNDKLDVVRSNLQLMSQRGWIDIPISYTNGRKALITLEKGASGKAIFDSVLASWKQNPIQ